MIKQCETLSLADEPSGGVLPPRPPFGISCSGPQHPETLSWLRRAIAALVMLDDCL